MPGPGPGADQCLCSQWNVAVLLRWECFAFGAEGDEGPGDGGAGFGGADDGVDVAALGGDVGVGEGVLVFLGLLPAQLVGAGGGGELAAVEDADGAGGAHDGDLGGGPGEVDVAAEVLGAHDVVGAAVGLAGDDGDLGHGGLGVGVQQLGAAADDAGPFLGDAGQEAGHVDEGQHGDVERVAGADEPGGFLRRVDVEAAGQVQRLVGDHPGRGAGDPPEPDDDVAGEPLVDLAERAGVEDGLDDGVHVVGLAGGVGDEGVEGLVGGGELVVGVGGQVRGLFEVVGGQVGQQQPGVADGVLFLGGLVGGDAGPGHVGGRAAEFLEGDVLAGD